MILEELKKEISKWLKDYFEDKINKKQYNSLIYEAMSYSLSVGGKRIRPILLMLSYGLYKENYKDVIEMAAAIEMIHTYSLIHDDLPSMDNDDLRRGKPTCHKVYGEGMAILAGDALLNEAANVLVKYAISHGEKALRATDLILEASGSEGMIGGQVVDILSENKKIDLDQLNYIHRNKTGALIKASILAGALVGGASEEELRILANYGEKLGLAFQIKDDILDVIGDTNLLGKNINSDLENHKTTYVTEYGLEKCKIICGDLTSQCIALLDQLNLNTTELKKLTDFLLVREY
ncbi:Farnesyl diphosphate synthase [Clostridium sp. N3C]|uniref:polyprenyl synthetase family protein n=1 Tax=Clostridium sp. N3C TaxID=1776758 RepID=UPI00092E1305|nr:farnesyl diphosphate synthase [Clostridium sp. N3C]SCN21385.1 Farnesyl diphosphate synthase [Clostridium sp. N3C]